MEILWLGHSSFRLRGSNVTVVTDPYEETVGFSLPPTRASLVTVSNDHPHHSNWPGVLGDPYVITGPGEYEVSGVFITGMGTTVPGEAGPRLNTLYLMEMDGLTLCHLGDLAQPLSSAQVEELSNVQVLFVPAGGVCTPPAPQLAEAIGQLDPRIVIPMHYHVPGLQVELEPLEPFLRELGVQEPQRQPRLSVTPTTLPAELRVVVLERAV